MTTAEVLTHPAAKQLLAHIVELSSQHLSLELPTAQANLYLWSSKLDMARSGSESLKIIAALPKKKDQCYLITPAQYNGAVIHRKENKGGGANRRLKLSTRYCSMAG